MRFAAKVSAEPGWRVILSKDDGGMSLVDIEEWGIIHTRNGMKLVPLDLTTGEDITKRFNFLRVIDPNEDFDFALFEKTYRTEKFKQNQRHE